MRKIILAGFLSSIVFVGCNKKEERKVHNTTKENKLEKVKKVDKTQSKVVVFSIANKDDLKKFGELKLDETHENMLDRSVAKESFDVAMESWVDIHTKLNTYLMNENFDWGIEDERIKIFNKIYFQKDGRVKYYVYGVYADVSPEKVTAFGKLAKEFFANQKISLTRDVDFAQCGKASLLNSKI